MSFHTKKELEMQLSILKSFETRSVQLEQYPTPSNIAAEWVWNMAMKREVAGRKFLDGGCGSGILGLGLLLLGAKKVYFLDTDASAIKICIENYNLLKEEYEIGEAQFLTSDISLFDGEVDIVIQNPPFGTKEEHADKRFLEKAFSVAKVVYSMHKYSTAKFVEAIARDYGFTITEVWRYEFPVKAAFKFHEKPVKFIDAAVWRMEKG